MKRTTLSAITVSAVVLTAGLAQAAEVAGAINANGTRQIKSSQYTVSHPSTGRYVIHFTHAFPSPYATCLFMPLSALSASGLVEKTTSCDVTFINSAGKLTNATPEGSGQVLLNPVKPIGVAAMRRPQLN